MPFFRKTPVMRGGAAARMTGLKLLFWLSDLAGAPWTSFSPRGEETLFQGER